MLSTLNAQPRTLEYLEVCGGTDAALNPKMANRVDDKGGHGVALLQGTPGNLLFVHLEELLRKQRSLPAARTGPHLQHSVAGVHFHRGHKHTHDVSPQPFQGSPALQQIVCRQLADLLVCVSGQRLQFLCLRFSLFPRAEHFLGTQLTVRHESARGQRSGVPGVGAEECGE